MNTNTFIVHNNVGDQRSNYLFHILIVYERPPDGVLMGLRRIEGSAIGTKAGRYFGIETFSAILTTRPAKGFIFVVEWANSVMNSVFRGRRNFERSNCDR